MKSHCEIAIVGGGPRGLFALDELVTSFRSRNTSNGGMSASVTLFDPESEPGAGNVYATGQPDYLRMNFASEHVDSWSVRSRAQATDSRCSLLDWLEIHRPEFAGSGEFVPRSVVGAYLSDCFEKVRRSLPKSISLELKHEEVLSISPRPDGEWTLCSRQGRYTFDQVLIAVGHEGWRPPSPNHGPEWINGIFPVDRQLSRKKVPAGAKVAVRGFSLTWIDAVLALTVGRGGAFQASGGAIPLYDKSGDEPLKIFPFCRSGRPMLAKPNPACMSIPAGLADHWEEWRSRLFKANRERFTTSFAGHIQEGIFRSAAEALQRCGKESGIGIEEWFRVWCEEKITAQTVEKRMRNSVEIAVGDRPPDEGWALGEAWRSLYPAIVASIEHGRLEEPSWVDFHTFSSEMERIAFGPPSVNLARILSLVDAGIVDLSHLRKEAPDADILIDARIAAPCSFKPDSILDQLRKNGIIRQLHGRYGIVVDRSARALDADGNPVGGLAILGRATEGCVIGNDTLSRKLNRHPEAWADSIWSVESAESVAPTRLPSPATTLT